MEKIAMDLKDILYILNALVVPIAVWLWRMGVNQRVQNARTEGLERQFKSDLQNMQNRISEMPNHQTVHEIQLGLSQMQGDIRESVANQKAMHHSLNRLEEYLLNKE